MYCPASFEEHRLDVLLRLIAEHPLATLVRQGEEGLVADHVPLMHVPTPAGAGHLIGHVARANPLWQVAPQERLLLVFQGPQAYISPNWYATKADGGKVVPTWNYAVVHVHAQLTPIHSPQAVMDILQQLTRRHEANQPHPWAVDDAPADFTKRLLTQIVGVRLEILGMQGKWKVSQNQPQANQASVSAALQVAGTTDSLSMSSLVEGHGIRV